MVTYRRELERKGWHRPFPVRILLLIVGLGLLLAGWVAWDLEQEKGGWEGSGLGHFVVEDDELGDGVLVRGENDEILFEGDSYEDVDEWIESQRNRNFTVPILLLASGALFLVAGIGPSPKRQVLVEAKPHEEVRT